MGSETVKPSDCTRRLGVVLDRKLNFKEHVRRVCQRFRVVIDHMKRLYNTVRGTNPYLLRAAMHSTALANYFYGSETWVGPRTSVWILNQIQSSINRAT